jgi:hypothetical protein
MNKKEYKTERTEEGVFDLITKEELLRCIIEIEKYYTSKFRWPKRTGLCSIGLCSTVSDLVGDTRLRRAILNYLHKLARTMQEYNFEFGYWFPVPVSVKEAKAPRQKLLRLARQDLGFTEKHWWDSLCLRGHGLTASKKLRVWWFALSLVLLGSLAEAPFWLLALLTLNLAVSGMSVANIANGKNGGETEEEV